ncbi:dihydropteroate synthase, partial [Enterococcus faecium]|nr:dihydropteroate synthase [Enterococcus faecium]EME7205080.1 dihydropteroate synthase [Enterococcus faecium]
MGIVNVTPDSFSDGGQFYQPQLAINHAYKLLEEGADIIDIGGQSTRPGFKEVSPEEEIRRIRPVLEFLCKENILLSIDTYFPKVADYALSMGVSILNDIRGLDHKGMLDIACKYPHTKLIITHSRNRKEKLTLEKDIQSFYREKYHLCLSYGINK